MVITAIDGESFVHTGDSHSQEMEVFHRICARWKEFSNGIMAEKDPDRRSVFHRTTDTMTCRYINGKQEHLVVVAFVASSVIMSKKWKYQDKIIKSSQGGETHLKGWYLE